MANNIHFEARRKQMFLDRVAKANKDLSPRERSSVVSD